MCSMFLLLDSSEVFMQKISDSEWIVMRVIWEKNPVTASEIINRLKSVSTWNSKTIHTLISRLVNKEVLGVSKEGAYYTYYPLVSEEECTKEQTKSFLNKVYNGSLNVMVSNFLKVHKLTKEEIEELQQILDQNKGDL